MRRLSFLLAVVAAIVVLPALAQAGNQEVAEQVAANLRDSGQLQGYKVGVKFQEGTAWLRGRVASHEQMNSALRVAYDTDGVERVVNNLVVDLGLQTSTVEQKATPKKAKFSVANLLGGPLRPMTAATAPERRPSTSSAAYQRTSSHQVAMESAAELPKASPVATVFEKAPAMPVTAESTPPMPAIQEPMMVAQADPTPVAYLQDDAPIAAAQYLTPLGSGAVPARYDQPNLPNYAWPSYAAHPNYAAVTYPKQCSPQAWPYIGPFYPYPQVPMGWRKVTLEWHDGWWQLDFDDGSRRGPFSGLFRPHR